MEDKKLINSKEVEFRDVSYTVTETNHFYKVTGTREILKSVSGIFRNGELSAIMGPSGAGKSSLLNAISKYRTSGVQGHMKIDRESSCYIVQEDQHQPLLTVQELMYLAYDLKVKDRRSKEQSVSEILNHLNLNHQRNSTAVKLSGGERKRLSIAVELVANPKIVFLDEPTTGLDEVTAAQCIRLLKLLASEGRTIVCTIHQPSATIFNYFDNIYVLAKGMCVYQGAPSAIIPFLNQMNLVCPTHYSPSDFIIELCDFSSGEVVPSLSEIVQNGKLYCVDVPESQIQLKSVVTSMALETRKSILTQFGAKRSSNSLFVTMKSFSKLISTESEISLWRQFIVLLKMMMIKIYRSKIPFAIQLFHHLFCGLGFGCIFYNSNNEAERMFDHLKFCVGCILVIVYTQVMTPILSYSMEVKLVKKEYFNRWYSLTAYYMALTVSRIPLQIFFNVVFLSLVYYLAGLPPQLWRFCLFSLAGLMVSFAAEGFGLAIGATFSMVNANAVGPMLIGLFLGLAMYGFDFAKDVPLIMYGIMKLSYIRVAVVAMVLSVFGFNREVLDCNEIYCHFADPKVVLRFLDTEHVSYWNELLFLGLLLIFYRVVLFISITKRCKT